MGTVYAPRNATYTVVPATEKQLAFLKRLQAERVVSEKIAGDIAFELEQPTGPTKRIISEIIDDLLKAPYSRATQAKTGPKQPPLPEVPTGRYAVEGRDGKLKFIRVSRPADGAWAGWTFVEVQAGDEFWRLKGDQPRKALEAVLAYGPKEASLRYGHELGHCGVCGRTLTDADSRAAGIGPVCRVKLGW